MKEMGSLKCAVINAELEMLGYKCERIIGGGSFSTVIRAVRKEDKKKVAIKVLKKKKLTVSGRLPSQPQPRDLSNNC